MHGRMLDAETSAVIGEGEVQFSDDRQEGNIACVLKSETWNAGPRAFVLELESGERLPVAIVGRTGPYVQRRPDGHEEIGRGVTSFRVLRQ